MKLKNVLVVAWSAGLAACAAQGPRETRAEFKPADAYASARSLRAPAVEWPSDAWWQPYGDAQLDAIMAEALAGSPSLAIADARLRRAQAYAQIQGASRKPQISANTQIIEQKQSYNYLSPPQGTPQNWNAYGRATLDFTWELDFWGKNRAALAAATSDAEAARADAAQARITLTTSIAASYAELARLHSALDTAQSSLQVRVDSVALFSGRHHYGLENVASLRQIEARRASTESEVFAIQEQLALQRNQIAALMGAGPDRGLTIQRPTIEFMRTFGLPENLPAELIGRRADVVAARLRAQAAAKRVKQAEAAFYPNVNLVAFAGFQSLGLNMLMNNDSFIGSAGPAITLPIFTGGKLRGQLKSADAEYAEAVASYENTLVQALQDVADAAASRRALGAQIVKTDEAVAAAREAYDLTSSRYKGGLSTYLDVLSAEETLLSNLRTQSDLQSRVFTLDVAMVRALGGGYLKDRS